MKQYPTITKEVRQDVYIYAFDKLDGSNIRAEWSSKKGFYKFGTRHHLMDETTKPWNVAIPLIKDKYEQDLAMVFREQGWRDAMCFFELWGPDSFAGTHNFEKPLTVTLFDVNPLRHGILEPYEFLKYFGHLDHAKVLFEGHVTVDLFDKVKQSKLPGMTFEGVVCKGASMTKAHQPTMFKIKSHAWLDKLTEYCKGNDKLFAMLE